MGTETLLVLVIVGALAGWVLLAFADDGGLHGGDDFETAGRGRRLGDDGCDRHLHGLAALGLTRETCVWIHETMSRDYRTGIEDRAIL